LAFAHHALPPRHIAHRRIERHHLLAMLQHQLPALRRIGRLTHLVPMGQHFFHALLHGSQREIDRIFRFRLFVLFIAGSFRARLIARGGLVRGSGAFGMVSFMLLRELFLLA